MKVCIVGQGPSAEGMGAGIDSCEFVVRLRAWWKHGAPNAGSKIDAQAQFGHGWEDERPEFCSEIWMTHCPKQWQATSETVARAVWLIERAATGPMRCLTNEMWKRLCSYIGSHPSTGFVAVAMALDRFPSCELHLHGFDSTMPEAANYWDARQYGPHKKVCHDMLAEKRAIHKIASGTWLGAKTDCQLHWPAMPNLG